MKLDGITFNVTLTFPEKKEIIQNLVAEVNALSNQYYPAYRKGISLSFEPDSYGLIKNISISIPDSKEIRAAFEGVIDFLSNKRNKIKSVIVTSEKNPLDDYVERGVLEKIAERGMPVKYEYKLVLNKI